MDSKLQIAGPALPDMPWEERPAGCKHILWRCSANPIIDRYALPTSNSIFNSAVVPFKSGRYNYAGVFRCDDTNIRMRLHAGFSANGLDWEIEEEDIRFEGADPEVGRWVYGYDPRVVLLDGKYYITWCNGYEGQPTIGIAWTDDFKTFHQLENAKSADATPCCRARATPDTLRSGTFTIRSRPTWSSGGGTASSCAPRSSRSRHGSAQKSGRVPCLSRHRKGG